MVEDVNDNEQPLGGEPCTEDASSFDEELLVEDKFSITLVRVGSRPRFNLLYFLGGLNLKVLLIGSMMRSILSCCILKTLRETICNFLVERAYCLIMEPWPKREVYKE